MKRNLIGKIVLIVLFNLSLFGAWVEARLDKIASVSGEVVTLSIRANGKKVQFPNINKIGSYSVVGTSTSKQISIVNGTYQENITKSYQFIPSKSLKIPSYSIKIDGKIYHTKPLELKVFPPQMSKNNDTFVFRVKLLKHSVYVNESVVLEYIFKYRVGANLLDVNLDAFQKDGFWVKKVDTIKPLVKNGYVIQKQRFVILPQNSGTFEIGPKYINIATRDNYGFIRWKKVYSNRVKLKVKDVSGVNLVGDFSITASVDKYKIYSNDPVNLSIKVQGFGNIDDIDQFSLDIPDVIVYKAKPNIKSFIKNGKYGGVFEQKISLISDTNFTIPSISIRYFDQKTKKIVTKSTQPIKIKVLLSKKHTSKLQVAKPVKTKIVYKDANLYIKYIYLAVGFVLGSVFVFVMMRKIQKNIDIEMPIEKKIKKAKSNKELYELLLPYINNKKIKQIILDLEKNIYNNDDIKIDKKMIIESLLYYN